MKLSNRVVLFNDENLKTDVNSAAKDIQTIYIQAVSGTSSVNPPSTWVSVSDESVSGTPPNASAGQTPHWTTKKPTYQKNYPVIFVAEQRRGVNSTTPTCSTPVKDDTNTIIDGGHITTGTIDASKVTVTNIDATKITVGTTGANINSDIATAATKATGYITNVGTTGIQVHAVDNPTSNYTQIDANGMEVYKGGSSVAAFGVAARIGRDNASRVELESNRISLISENGLPAIQAVTSGKEIGTIYAVHALYDRLVGNTNSNVYTINLSAVANTAPFYVTIESRYGYTLTLSTQYTVWSGDFDKSCDSVRIDFTKKSQSESKSATIKMASSITAQYDPNPFVAKTDKSVTVVYNASNSTLTITTPAYPAIADSQYSYGTGTNYITNGDSYLEITVVSAYFSKYIPRTDIYGRAYLDMNTGADPPDDIDDSILASLNALGWASYCIE